MCSIARHAGDKARRSAASSGPLLWSRSKAPRALPTERPYLSHARGAARPLLRFDEILEYYCSVLESGQCHYTYSTPLKTPRPTGTSGGSAHSSAKGTRAYYSKKRSCCFPLQVLQVWLTDYK